MAENNIRGEFMPLSKVVKKTKNLSINTSIILILFTLIFFIITVFFSTKIHSQITNIKEHPFPVVIAAGEVETRIYQMEMLTERLEYARSEEAINTIENHFNEIEVISTNSAQIIVDRYLASTDDSKRMQELLNEVIAKQKELLELCRTNTLSNEEIQTFTAVNITPLYDEILVLTSSFIDNATIKFDTFADSAKSYKNIMIFIAAILVIAVISSISLYLYILRKKELQELKVQKDMEVALAAAQAANKAKTQFLSNMSHDIRTPMNAIIGMTAIASTCLDDKEKVKNCLGKISTSSKHLLGLINDVLDMSKIESGKVILSEEKFNFPELIHNVVSIIQPQTKAKQLELELAIYSIQNESAFGDTVRIQQILLNLLGNAVKFTNPGGTISLKITQKPSMHQGYANFEFIISDNGIGMTDEFQKHLFEPFERANTTTVSRTEGTGLGMAISKNIIDMMGGQITVDSKSNVGTTCIINLNLKVFNDKTGNFTNSQLADLRSLVVDDDKDVCENTVNILKEIGMASEWVLSGAEAIEKVVSAHIEYMDYHAVIIDWKMPEMDGIETTRRIRNAIGNETPIIILTAYDWSEIEDEALEAGVTAFIPKPLFKSRLYEVLENVMIKKEEKFIYQQPKYADFSGHRILLVEDNELNIEIVEELLKMQNIDVVTARDGQQALNEHDKDSFDLILMDIQMPVMDGYTATERIRLAEQVSHKHIPIVGLSANAFSEDRENAINSGMDDYITKPISMSEMQTMLERYLVKELTKV